MLLYHFTARRFVESIRTEGLTRGCLLLNDDPIEIMRGWQWLTQNGDASDQEWAAGTGRLPYSRTEVRLSVEIPKLMEVYLIHWPKAAWLTPMHGILSAYGDPQNWWLYKGPIPARWIAQ